MTWNQIQMEIAACTDCTRRWPNDVCRPIGVGEIPDPPAQVKVLLVGVAPTPDQGRNAGRHFYASPDDNLRRETFKILACPPMNLRLSGLSLADANLRFFEAGFFFVHAAKVRPTVELSPPHECMRYCADRHLRAEMASRECAYPRGSSQELRI